MTTKEPRGLADDDSADDAEQRQQDGLGQELGADLAAGGAQRPAQPDQSTVVTARAVPITRES